MRTDTMKNRLFELLEQATGQDLSKHKVDTTKKTTPKNYDRPVGVSDAELDSYREAQAISYFFRAPDLFSAKTCPHCNESFLVSRQFVGFCSYTCIYKDLQEKGISWSRKTKDGFDIDETYIQRVYEGNEPLWIRSSGIDAIRKVLAATEENLLTKSNG